MKESQRLIGCYWVNDAEFLHGTSKRPKLTLLHLPLSGLSQMFIRLKTVSLGGITIGVPTQAISMDPDVYPNPDQFGGFRFSKLRSSNSPGAARLVYAASDLDSMAFAHGHHADHIAS